MLSTQNATSSPGATPVILLALTAHDRAGFLPDLDPAAFAPARVIEADAASFTSATWLDYLAETRPTVLVTGWGSPGFPPALVADPDLSLRYCCHLAGTVKPYVPRALLERGILVSNWGATVSHAVAEQALLLVLATLRNLPAWEPFMRAPLAARSSRSDSVRTRTLHGKRVGIHGFGAVARALNVFLQPFRVVVSAYSEGVPAAVFAQHGVTAAASMDELFAHSDVLVECEALTPRTRGSVDRRLLKLLPADAVFVNVGRGDLVDEAALLDQARAGRLRIGLDVMRIEPPPPDSPWFDAPGALLSPHIGGPTHDMYADCGQFALENIRRFLAGQPLEGEVTLESFDRST